MVENQNSFNFKRDIVPLIQQTKITKKIEKLNYHYEFRRFRFRKDIRQLINLEKAFLREQFQTNLNERENYITGKNGIG